MPYERYQALKIERKGRILRVTIDRPEARNAINEQLHLEFSTLFGDVESDPDAHVVILTGAGGAFCGGGDLGWLRDTYGDMQVQMRNIKNDRRIQTSMLEMEKPIIARVVGPAVGLGASLALYCDFIYATPDAIFADPHVSVGLVAGDGGALIWPQLIGYARAKRYLLTGDPITGTDAAEMGLITEAVPEDRIDEVVDAMAERLASGATQAIRWTKASINAGLRQVATSVLERALGYEHVSMLTADHKIGIDAFAERRKPEFRGR